MCLTLFHEREFTSPLPRSLVQVPGHHLVSFAVPTQVLHPRAFTMEWPRPLQHIPAISQYRQTSAPTTFPLPRSPPSLPTSTPSHHMTVCSFRKRISSFPSAPNPKGTQERTHAFLPAAAAFPQEKKKDSKRNLFTLSISFSSSMVCLLATSSWTVWPQFLTTDSMTCKGQGNISPQLPASPATCGGPSTHYRLNRGHYLSNEVCWGHVNPLPAL